MTPSLLLQAFEGKNKTIPVWFMRQAGRYLPEYRKLKERYSLNEMFHTPELAAEVTCLPIGILKVDAAILFADILSLPSAMGFKVEFTNQQGPKVLNPFKRSLDLQRLHDIDNLDYLVKTIKLIKQRLPSHIPLIGFAGSPFTVLTYLLENGFNDNFTYVFRLAENQPDVFHELMEILTRNTIGYLNIQKKAGIGVFQIFDTWAGILRPADYANWVLPYVRKIFQEVELPSIYYIKNCNHLLPLMDQAAADFLSVCHTVVLGHHLTLERTEKGIQGNLFNGLLYADYKVLEKEVKDVLMGGVKHKRYIFNLSHGIFPDTDVDKLKFVVHLVHEFKC